jgi:hypothetical protein
VFGLIFVFEKQFIIELTEIIIAKAVLMTQCQNELRTSRSVCDSILSVLTCSTC